MQPQEIKLQERRKKITNYSKESRQDISWLGKQQLVSGTLHVANIAALRMASGWV